MLVLKSKLQLLSFKAWVAWVLIFLCPPFPVYSSYEQREQCFQYGMSFQELKGPLNFDKAGLDFQLRQDSYRLVRDRYYGVSSSIYLFRNNQFIAHMLDQSIAEKMQSCFVSPPVGTGVEDCLQRQIDEAVTGRVLESRLCTTVMVTHNQTMEKIVGYSLAVPIVIIMLPAMLPWILEGGDGDGGYRPNDQVSEYQPIKAKRQFKMPELGDYADVSTLIKKEPALQAVDSYLIVPSIYVKKNKAAFAVHDGKVVMVLNCNFGGELCRQFEKKP